MSMVEISNGYGTDDHGGGKSDRLCEYRLLDYLNDDKKGQDNGAG